MEGLACYFTEKIDSCYGCLSVRPVVGLACMETVMGKELRGVEARGNQPKVSHVAHTQL